MRILFTGASSFTGFWFARELVRRGHTVVATFTAESDAYDPRTLRGRRLRALIGLCEPVYGTSFGDERFLALLDSSGPFDRLCHHGAVVGDYRSPGFDVLGAVATNTRAVGTVLEKLVRRGCGGLVLTGTVFERGEGLGGAATPPASAYGLSKSLSADIIGFEAARHGLALSKFVIPNPFGAFEEARFTAYLIETWLAGRTPVVRTPEYVRDNIHAELLASAYAAFTCDEVPSGTVARRSAPSGYVQTQGEFARRVASEMRDRLAVECALELAEQHAFAEPRVRINSDVVDAAALGIDPAAAWDAMAEHYLARAPA